MISIPDPPKPGDRIRAADQREMIEALKALFTSSGADVFVDATGIHIRRKRGAGRTTIPTGQYPRMVLQVISANVIGFGWVEAHDGV